MLMGEDAVIAIATRGAQRAAAIFDHTKPQPVPWDVDTDMTKLSSQQVGQAYQYFVGMHSYAQSELSKVDGQLTVLEFRRRITKDTILLGSTEAKSKKYNLDAKVSLDSQHLALTTQILELQTYKTALEATVNGLQNKAQCFSRELTRRESDQRVHQRSGY